MRRIRRLILLIAVAAFNVQAAPASAESIDRLAAMNAESLMIGVLANIEQLTALPLDQPANAGQRRMRDALRPKLAKIMREQLNWAAMKPRLVQLDAETFDQAEVDGLLAFYASPAGQAYLAKMPQAARRSKGLSQSIMQAVMPQIDAETVGRSEADGVIAFYASPVGQTCLAKLPQVAQRAVALSQSILQAAMPQIKAAVDEAAAEAKAATH